jgi:hypothetical protein
MSASVLMWTAGGPVFLITQLTISCAVRPPGREGGEEAWV